ncbi:MAG: hypothetical protein ABR874_04265 [Candidatus Sulfotelmatobacter sp.]|jgi:hypothetical protein
MQTWNKLLLHISFGALCAPLFFGGPLRAVAQAMPEKSEQSAVSNTTDQLSADENSSSQLPDSPGVTLAKLEAEPQTGAPQSTNAPPSDSSSTAQQQQNQNAPQKPVGTAAAGAPDASGIAASQPAGAAIAPAKQHRTRTIVIKVGAIIGAGVAVGTIVALTAATSSKPPGAH